MRVAQQGPDTIPGRLPGAANNQGEVCSLHPTAPHDGDDDDLLLGGVPRGQESQGVSNHPDVAK